MNGEVYEKRIERVREAMARRGLSRLLVSDPNGIWYLTGVWTEPYERMFLLLIGEAGPCTLFLNRMFTVPHTGHREVWYSDTEDPVARLAEALGGEAPLGVDKDWPARFLLPLMGRRPDLKLLLGSDCLDEVRARKDGAEQALMREASRINDETVGKAAEYIREGMTEKQAAEYIGRLYREAGCDGQSFTTIVSFGANAADPHHEPDGTVLKDGDCVLIDTGCVWRRYCSDMTRTYFCRSADPEYAAIHDLVREANEKAEGIIRPGVPLRDVDAAARDHIAAAGYGENFTHRLGHFIGLKDHEKGDVSQTSGLVAEEGMIFSIEPGVYLPGRFGVRIEDLVLVTAGGCERLNKLDKRLRIIG